MATLRKRKGKWTVEIRRKGHRKVYATFVQKSDARGFINKVKNEIQQQKYKDTSEAANTTFKVVLHRYIREIIIKNYFLLLFLYTLTLCFYAISIFRIFLKHSSSINIKHPGSRRTLLIGFIHKTRPTHFVFTKYLRRLPTTNCHKINYKSPLHNSPFFRMVPFFKKRWQG